MDLRTTHATYAHGFRCLAHTLRGKHTTTCLGVLAGALWRERAAAIFGVYLPLPRMNSSNQEEGPMKNAKGFIAALAMLSACMSASASGLEGGTFELGEEFLVPGFLGDGLVPRPAVANGKPNNFSEALVERSYDVTLTDAGATLTWQKGTWYFGTYFYDYWSLHIASVAPTPKQIIGAELVGVTAEDLEGITKPRVTFDSRNVWIDLQGLYFKPGDTLTVSIDAISAVPEPATYALMLSGAVAVGVAARRGRRA